MTVKNAMDNFHWIITERTGFNATERDVESYNTIAAYVEQQRKQRLIDNQLFGKMYIYLYGRFCIYYKTGPWDRIPQIELHKLLDKKLPLLITEFVQEQNASEFARHIEAGFEMKLFVPMTYDEVAENFRNLINSAIDAYTQ